MIGECPVLTPEVIESLHDLIARAWAQAGPCEDCGAEAGQPCEWICLGRPEMQEPPC